MLKLSDRYFKNTAIVMHACILKQINREKSQLKNKKDSNENYIVKKYNKDLKFVIWVQ